MPAQGSDGLKHFVHVAVIIVLHAHAAPFLHEHAFGINEESAAFNAFYLAAIHDFVFDHAEHMAHFLFGIGNQLEGQFQLGLEGVVRFHVVAADAENGGARLDEFLVLITKMRGFSRAAGGIVLRVEVEHQHLPGMRDVGDLDSSGGHGFKFGQRFVDDDRH